MSALLPNLLHFGEVLRAVGLDVPTAAVLDVASAMAHVDIGRRSDFYYTLRSLLVHRVLGPGNLRRGVPSVLAPPRRRVVGQRFAGTG